MSVKKLVDMPSKEELIKQLKACITGDNEMSSRIKKRKKSFKCVYCDKPIPYEGSCEICGRKEDKALGKLEEV